MTLSTNQAPVTHTAQTTHSIATILQTLSERELISAEDPQRTQFIIEQQSKDELPLYLRMLVGAGSFFAFIFFSMFLALSKVFNNIDPIYIGVILIISAIVIYQNIDIHSILIKDNFCLQLSFMLISTGKFFFVVGFTEYTKHTLGNELISVFIGLLIISVSTYHIYKISIDRFLSVLSTLLALGAVLGDIRDSTVQISLFNLFLIIQLIMLSYLFMNGKVKRKYIPIAYSIICSLYFIVLSSISGELLLFKRAGELINLIPFQVALTVWLLLLIAWAAGEWRALTRRPLLGAAVGVLLLGLISTSGLLLTIGVIILGYAHHHRLLVILSTLILPVVIIYYYYNMNLTLMEKSGVLVGSGFVLLLGRWYAKYNHQNIAEEHL